MYKFNEVILHHFQSLCFCACIHLKNKKKKLNVDLQYIYMLLDYSLLHAGSWTGAGRRSGAKSRQCDDCS